MKIINRDYRITQCVAMAHVSDRDRYKALWLTLAQSLVRLLTRWRAPTRKASSTRIDDVQLRSVKLPWGEQT